MIEDVRTALALRSALAGLAALAAVALGQGGPREPSPTLQVDLLIFKVSKLPAKDRAAAYEAAAKTAAKAKDMPGEALALSWEAAALADYSEYREGLPILQEALKLARASGWRSMEGKLLVNIGVSYGSLGDQRKGLDYQQSALGVQHDLPDRGAEAVTLNDIGASYVALGQYRQALEYQSRALALQWKYDPKRLGPTLNDLGVVYSDLGEHTKALRCYQEALAVVSKSGTGADVAGALNNIGEMHRDLGQYTEALENYQQAIRIDRASGGGAHEASALNNLGELYEQTVRPQEALGTYDRALIIEREIHDPWNEATTLANSAIALLKLGRNGEALRRCRRALAISRSIGAVHIQSSALADLGWVYQTLRRRHEAISSLEEALPLRRRVGDRGGEATTLMELGSAYLALHHQSLGIFFEKQAARLYQSIRRDQHAMPTGLRRSYAETTASQLDELSLALIDSKRLPEAIQALSAPGREDLTAIDYTAAEKAWAAEYERKADAIGRDGREAQLLQLVKQLDRAQIFRLRGLKQDSDRRTLEFSRFLAGIARESDRGSRRTELASTSESVALLAALRKLPPGTRAVFAVPEATRLSLLIADRRGLGIVSSAVTSLRLVRLVRTFRVALQDPLQDPRAPGKALYDLMIRPLEGRLADGGVTMWNLAGVLRNIPVAALWDGRRYALEKYRMENFNPAYLASLAASPTGRRRGVVLGTTGAHSVKDPVSSEPLGFPELPGARAEVESVSHQLGSTPILDGEFTARKLVSCFARRPRIVHIASHFRYFAGDDRRSFLLTGDGGIWTVEAIKALPANALAGVELVTLSACATASGSNADGSQMESFGAWMQRKGAKAVVSTLWDVTDLTTGALMARFYRGLRLHPGWTKLDSLRQAQLALLRGDEKGGGPRRGAIVLTRSRRGDFRPDIRAPLAHPYYWAPFVLSGNWR